MGCRKLLEQVEQEQEKDKNKRIRPQEQARGQKLRIQKGLHPICAIFSISILENNVMLSKNAVCLLGRSVVLTFLKSDQN